MLMKNIKTALARIILGRKRLSLLFLTVFLVVLISGISYCISLKNKSESEKRGSSSQQEVLGLEKNKSDQEEPLHNSQKRCEDGSIQGYVRVNGTIARPQWLESSVPLSIISDNEIYPVTSEGRFCVFALKKTSFISLVRENETDEPIMLYVLAGNKDKEITIDSYSTAVALIFQGTRAMWQGSNLEESITAFSFIQQDENTQRLADAIFNATEFVAKNFTGKGSTVSEIYQQAVSSVESRRRNEIPDSPDISFVIVLSPVDFYRDEESEYLVTGKIDSLEKISQQLLLQSDVAKNVRVGNQIGIFVDAAKIPPPMDKLNIGYNEKKVRITARFDKVKGQFIAEDLAVL